ncbi:MAG: mandelate racemase/muconate lactonizing enzyme family protein [Spirochaetota bacterium]
MKITGITVTVIPMPPLERPFWNSIVRTTGRGAARAEITTDEGITGMAPCGARVKNYVEGTIAPKLIGQDPLRIEHLWNTMYMGGTRKPVAAGADIVAMSVVDNALWDLKGKALNTPVWKLAGGAQDSVWVYAAGGYYEEGKGIAELCKEMESYVAEGFGAVKMKVGWPGAGLPHDAERVRAVRKAIGDEVELMVDANNAWDANNAIRFGRMIEDARAYWFEEPVHADDFEGAAKVADALDVPVASGENTFTRFGFRDLIERGATEVVQADPNTCGGISEWLKIAAQASAGHLPMAPHGKAEIGCSCVAAVGNGLITEHYPTAFRSELTEPLTFRNGRIEMPDEPGLGIVWREDEIARRV